MKTGKSIVDQIQDALREMEDTGFLDDPSDHPEVDGEKAEDEAISLANRAPMKHRNDASSSCSPGSVTTEISFP